MPGHAVTSGELPQDVHDVDWEHLPGPDGNLSVLRVQVANQFVQLLLDLFVHRLAGKAHLAEVAGNKVSLLLPQRPINGSHSASLAHRSEAHKETVRSSIELLPHVHFSDVLVAPDDHKVVASEAEAKDVAIELLGPLFEDLVLATESAGSAAELFCVAEERVNRRTCEVKDIFLLLFVVLSRVFDWT